MTRTDDPSSEHPNSEDRSSDDRSSEDRSSEDRSSGDRRLPISWLIGSRVRDADGRHVGHVTDVRLRPARSLGAPVLRVQTLLVDVRHVGSRFGYERDSQRGPWAVRAVIRRLHRNAQLIDWRDIESFDPDEPNGPTIVLRADYRARETDPA
jgi:sporulation protein YlmC with PRC-barrel domain